MAKVKEVTETLTKEERIKKLMKEMEKSHGEGAILGANDISRYHEVISTGSIGLDKALGIGGLPKGRIIEIYGPESSGKTTACLEAIVQAHKNPDSYCAIVDAEHAMDTTYAESLGIDLKRLKISQPDFGEQALEITEKLCASGDFDIVLVDSVAALVPKAEVEREMGESSMGKHALLMSQAMRKLTPVVHKSGTVLIFINQLRDKIGVMFGSPETTTGGNALKFYASVRIDVRRSLTTANSVMDGDEKIGNETTFKVVKNKLSPPFKKCSLDIIYGEGYDTLEELIETSVDAGIVGKSGSWFSYQETKIAQGKEQFKELLKNNPELAEEIKLKTIESFKPKELEKEEISKIENEEIKTVE